MTLFDEPLRTEASVEQPSAVRVRLLVAYDGSMFHGFAANAGVSTIAGALGDALTQVLRHPVQLTAAGRTDRGVHAWGQVVSFDATPEVDLGELRQSVNKLCGGAIVVRDADVVEPSFDARFSARARVYRYTILNQPTPDPFLRATAWWYAHPLDLRSMQLACDALIGEHDFSSFCRRPRSGSSTQVQPGAGPVSLVRRVIDARWSQPASERRPGLLRFEIEANAFCHQMVRSIVGTLVDVGHGKKRAGDMSGILRSLDRSSAGQLAPPHGLCLWDVRY
jgi:tRNA pseudouridine38-40 synthase